MQRTKPHASAESQDRTLDEDKKHHTEEKVHPAGVRAHFVQQQLLVREPRAGDADGNAGFQRLHLIRADEMEKYSL